MLANLNGWHLVIILFLVLLLFGAPKLPGLAKSVGESMKIFKKEVREVTDDGEKTADGTTTSTTDASTTPRSDAA
ncbi:twin-arginine translocase TatA/TatE family subunit [Paramicrobacterium agarici]|uniref:Sec-independent protein translocase protein TatA n=1 Tax=Paramicrobacterium agarici TaxID=630514 RepID=A0A2A9E1H9_9MICO|nr:twin-arginine translocase TatA/TatE family subunit [Microbacterium agarici]PFG32049.1 sec-independent protein translocase protein TatA [Microbacterium agarici]